MIILYTLYRRYNLFLLRSDLLHADYVGELVLDGKDLDLLIKSYRVYSFHSDARLIVKFVFEVLNVKVLQLCWHCLDLLEQLVIIIIHQNLLPVNHVMHVELCDFFESEWVHTH